MTRRRVLVAGIGNIFFGDDAYGVEVAQRLVDRPMPDGVKVADFGIRGLHLAYELLDGYDTLVLVDALPMGEPPGTVALIEPELDAVGRDETARPIEAHGMSPAVVLGLMTRTRSDRGAGADRRMSARGPRRGHRPVACRGRGSRIGCRCGAGSRRRDLPHRRKGELTMLRRIVFTSVLAGLAFLASRALPDVVRYFKMRDM